MQVDDDASAAAPEDGSAEGSERGSPGAGGATLLSLEDLTEDATFRMREEGDLSLLATDLARLGQLFPVDVRPVGEKFQLVCGFRRVAALKFLQREKVQARIHDGLSDEDALLMALASAIHALPIEHDVLAALQEELEESGRLFPAAQDMLERALNTDEERLAPETVDGVPDEEGGEDEEEEVDADELAGDVTTRLGEINQDLSLLADVFGSLDEGKKQELLTQLRYSADLVAFLEGK